MKEINTVNQKSLPERTADAIVKSGKNYIKKDMEFHQAVAIPLFII